VKLLRRLLTFDVDASTAGLIDGHDRDYEGVVLGVTLFGVRFEFWLGFIGKNEWADPKPEVVVGPYDPENTYTTGTGQKIVGVHPESECAGRACVIHNPSDHPMRDWPTSFRGYGLFEIGPPRMERICPHGVGHPDPDDLAYHLYVRGDESAGVHGCDGCCADAKITGRVEQASQGSPIVP